jgi:hypothetical protein
MIILSQYFEFEINPTYESGRRLQQLNAPIDIQFF